MKKILCLLVLFSLLVLITGCARTNLPEEMPDSFAFSINWGFDGKYDSSTKVLSNGYNYDLDVKCKTELNLSKEQLQEIYEIVRNAKIDTYKEKIVTNKRVQSPTSELKITIYYGGEEHSVILLNSYLNDDMSLYLQGEKVGKAIKKIVEEYITSSDEYKSLPENQLTYE